ncbi:D-isomer specific 2-hydroxyacid dehydrogenase [Mycotypha africana]|uniref:D-isomer specific 2-hydroxyacid dehydrogenase n=1 Tax=Mycotypha africana TaxID=64632 RepID=UPI002301CDC3|nr:D-isomer specific 2-hydroxyacid dehydrogenase [Mycotypha africana]KAI8984279.1 D-isomer specific 2-hydroxyacid dehydrogenase [Mycotypha africana]
MAPKVLVSRILPPQTQAKLLQQGFEMYQWQEDCAIPRNVLLEKVKGVDAIYCLFTERIDEELLEAAGPQLKVVATMSVGYDHIDVKAVKARNIKIGYTPGVLTDATADLTVLLTLGASRRIKEGIRAAEEGSWTTWGPTWLCGSQITNKTLGIVGMGRIGEAVAHRMKAFGVSHIVYSGRSRKATAEKNLNAEYVPFESLLTESDIIAVCCALTDETRDLFNYEAFKKMKKTAIFVNSARGGIVQQDDLGKVVDNTSNCYNSLDLCKVSQTVRALEENLIGAVGLDVTTPEPLPASHKLYTFPNCLILPHVGSATLETRENMAQMTLDNILAGLRDETLPFGI